ncbi:transposase domain-containing protein [Streptomyces sp. NBC_01589]
MRQDRLELGCQLGLLFLQSTHSTPPNHRTRSYGLILCKPLTDSRWWQASWRVFRDGAGNKGNGVPLEQVVRQDFCRYGAPLPARHCALPPGLTTVTRSLTVAGGRFAPGHLGELTQVLPFELVDAVLEETRSVQRRLRDLPSRVGVYFVLAMCLFPEVGYRLVWQKLITGLIDLDVARPSTKALRDLRRRVGATPLQRLFEVLAGTLAQPSTRGVRFGPFRTVPSTAAAPSRSPTAAATPTASDRRAAAATRCWS